MFNPDVPNLNKYFQPGNKEEKRSGGTLTKSSSSVKKTKETNPATKCGSEVTPKSKSEDRRSLALQQTYSPALDNECTSLTFTMGNNGNAEMSQVLDAINRMENSLATIKEDIKKVSDDSTELKAMYGDLKEQLNDNVQKQDEKFARFSHRLEILEEQAKLYPSNLNADEVRDVIKQQALARVTEVLDSSHDNSLTLIGEELAGKINRALEALDANARAVRKMNVVVKGLSSEYLQSPESVQTFLRDKCNVEVPGSAISTSVKPPVAVVCMLNSELKQKLLRSKAKLLAGTDIYIEPELTPRQQKISNKLKAAAGTSKKAGGKVRYAFQSVQIEGKWMTWDEFNDRPTPAQQPLRRKGHNSRQLEPETDNALSEDKIV